MRPMRGVMATETMADRIKPDELRSRIVRVFQLTTGSEQSPHGALTWFANETGRTQMTISHYVTGKNDPLASVKGLMALHKLRELEIKAGVKNPIAIPEIRDLA